MYRDASINMNSTNRGPIIVIIVFTYPQTKCVCNIEMPLLIMKI